MNIYNMMSEVEGSIMPFSCTFCDFILSIYCPINEGVELELKEEIEIKEEPIQDPKYGIDG